MIGMLMEAVVLAFIIGGIIGAVTALQLSQWNFKKVPVKISSESTRRAKNR